MAHRRRKRFVSSITIHLIGYSQFPKMEKVFLFPMGEKNRLMSKQENIDKQIYRLSPNIGKHYLPLYGGYACILAGGIALLVYVCIGDMQQRQTLSELLAAIIFTAAAALLTVLCYYLFGDCRRPCYKPDRSIIEREERFDDLEQLDSIVKMVQNGEAEKLMQLPSSTRADLIVIIYSDGEKRLTAMQAFENETGAPCPVTEIYFNEKKH